MRLVHHAPGAARRQPQSALFYQVLAMYADLGIIYALYAIHTDHNLQI